MKTWEPRYWDKVAKTEGCWIWNAATDRDGYGRFYLEGKVRRAHRIAYELANGSLHPDLEVDHTCHTPACVQPEHLRQATGKQNQENQAGPRVDSVSGIRGVTWAGAKGWRVRVKHHGKLYSGGCFRTLEEAGTAVVALRNRLFTHNDADRP